MGVNGSSLSTKGFGFFDIVLRNKKFGATLIITGDITVGAILGLDFLENHNCCPWCVQTAPVLFQYVCLMPETIQLFLKKGMKVACTSQLHEDCTTQNISAVTGHIPLSQRDQEALWSMVCKG